MSGWLCGNYALIPVSPAFQYHLPYFASRCGYNARQALLCFSSNLIYYCSFCSYFEILSVFMTFSYPYLCFSLVPLTFSHVTSGTNLAAWFLERPNSRTQQRESVCGVCVCVCTEVRKVLATQIQLHISRHTTRRKQRRENRLRPAILAVCRHRTQEESDTEILCIYKGASNTKEQRN